MDNQSQQKWFYAIGICGKTTANVAKMFKQMGWFVTGTDIQFIPPASDLLITENIPTEIGYHYSHLTKEFWEQKLGKTLNIPDHPTLGLIVESASNKNKEYLFALKNNIDIRPFSKIFNEYLVKPESIVVVGTAGKTTTTALSTFILKEFGFNPTYMIGADVIDFNDSLQNTNSSYSVIEGDEYFSRELSTGAKFLQYKPKYGIITKISWDHLDVYPTQQEYINEFKKFVDIIPENGFVVAKMDDKNIDEVVKNAKCKVFRYKFIDTVDDIQTSDLLNYFIVRDLDSKSTEVNFSIYSSAKTNLLSGSTKLIGNYNLENILANYILFTNINETKKIINADSTKLTDIILKFSGVKKRMEFIFKSKDLVVIDDFGVSPERASNSLNTIKQYYKDYKIISVFEPNTGSRPLEKDLFAKLYNNAFINSDLVIIPDLNDNLDLLKTQDLLNQLKELNYNAKYIASNNLVSELKNMIEPKTVVVFFSAFRLTQIAKEFASQFKM